MDRITLERIKTAHPKVREQLTNIYSEICANLKGKAFCRFAYVIRTFAEQAEIYKQGREKAGKIVTKAKAGFSWHNYGLAVDIVLVVDTNGDGIYETASWDTKRDFDGDGAADWAEVDAVFKKYGWESGAAYHDLPHYQNTCGLTIREALRRHNAGQVIAGTNFIKI